MSFFGPACGRLAGAGLFIAFSRIQNGPPRPFRCSQLPMVIGMVNGAGPLGITLSQVSRPRRWIVWHVSATDSTQWQESKARQGRELLLGHGCGSFTASTNTPVLGIHVSKRATKTTLFWPQLYPPGCPQFLPLYVAGGAPLFYTQLQEVLGQRRYQPTPHATATLSAAVQVWRLLAVAALAAFFPPPTTATRSVVLLGRAGAQQCSTAAAAAAGRLRGPRRTGCRSFARRIVALRMLFFRHLEIDVLPHSVSAGV